MALSWPEGIDELEPGKPLPESTEKVLAEQLFYCDEFIHDVAPEALEQQVSVCEDHTQNSLSACVGTCNSALAQQEDMLTAGMPKWAIITLSIIGGVAAGSLGTFIFLSVDKL